ncbi:hypothetical protein BD410DRAFT_750065 [Rickenella mellea]|uniref:Uncharacterized protein n=1 Tax=Rickenella mellea TaxID=50990 RepID=A0A4Y7Q1S4_9AGAM|nr:hypothetical protein BD410DRAFT_750065 [Rickenella mellea]
MCRYIAEGRKYTKCDHFVRLNVLALFDCGLRSCERSIKHPKNCTSNQCTSTLGPEIQKPIVTYDELCWACQSASKRPSLS